MRESYDIVGSYNNQRYTSIDGERSINCFEYPDARGKKEKNLIFTSGLVNTHIGFANQVHGFRASFVFGNNSYHVVGNQIFLVDNTNTVTLLGTINTTTGYVGIDANITQITFVDGQNGWVWDTSVNFFEQITDPGFPSAPLDVCTLDSFTVVISGNTPFFQLSELNNSLIWSDGTTTFTGAVATNLITVASTAAFATGTPVEVSGGSLPPPLAEDTTYYAIKISPTTMRLATTLANAVTNVPIALAGDGSGDITNNGQIQQGSLNTHPGTIVACRTLHRKLFLFSQNFTEVWENRGIGTNLPFRPNQSLLMEVGTASISSIATGFDRMFFLSQDKDGLGPVMEVIGAQAIPISPRALDFTLAQYASDPALGVSDSRGIMIRENGLLFYRLNFTAANHTFVYNSSMSTTDNQLWHEEEVLNGDRHPAQTHIYFNGINYYGHYSAPILYRVDSNVTTNDGEEIRRVRIGRPIVDPTYRRRRIDRFQLDLLQGTLDIIQVESVGLNILTESGVPVLTEGGQNLITTQSSGNRIGILRPKIYLSVSKDGGQTYGYKMEAPMGNLGQRTFRTVWRKLGVIPRGQAFVPKIEFYSTVPFVVLGASWDFEILPE